MKIVRRILILVGFILFMCMLSQVSYLLRERDSRLVTYLSPELRLTAEYLYANPLPTPTEHHFNPQPGTVIKTLDLEHDFSVCGIGDMFNSEWVINGIRVPRWMNDEFIMCNLGPVEWICSHNCFEFSEALKKGLNLVELRKRDYLFDSFLPSQPIYQWAFIIEASNPTPTFTPYPPYIPPTPTP